MLVTLLVQVHLSATNSVLWFFGDEIAHIPNKKTVVCVGGKIAPIFFNTMEDAGALPVEIDVSNMNMGDEVTLKIDHAAAKVTAFKMANKSLSLNLKLSTFR